VPLLRIQTSGPSSGSFKEKFDKVGEEVWHEWDMYLGDIWKGRQSPSFPAILQGDVDRNFQSMMPHWRILMGKIFQKEEQMQAYRGSFRQQMVDGPFSRWSSVFPSHS